MFPFLPILFKLIIGGIVSIVVAGAVIGLLSDVDESVRKHACKDAFKYRIEKAKARKINVGIFSESTDKLQDLEIDTKDEISSDIRNDLYQWHYL